MHAATDRLGRLRKLVLTAGQRGDAPQAEALLAGFRRGELGAVVADAAYDSDAIRRRVRQLRAGCCIRPNPTWKVRKRYSRRVDSHRNQIERLFGHTKRSSRIATRYEKKAVNFAGFVWLAATIKDVLWMSSLARTRLA